MNVRAPRNLVNFTSWPSVTTLFHVYVTDERSLCIKKYLLTPITVQVSSSLYSRGRIYESMLGYLCNRCSVIVPPLSCVLWNHRCEDDWNNYFKCNVPEQYHWPLPLWLSSTPSKSEFWQNKNQRWRKVYSRYISQFTTIISIAQVQDCYFVLVPFVYRAVFTFIEDDKSNNIPCLLVPNRLQKTTTLLSEFIITVLLHLIIQSRLRNLLLWQHLVLWG